MGSVPTLTDGVVTLRAHGEDDLQRCVEQCRDELSVRWTTVPVPYGIDEAKRFVRHAMPGGWATDQEWGFAVEHEGRYAGTVSLRNRGDARAEIAYGSHPDVRGQGVLSRALRLLLSWGFSPARDGGRGLETVVWLAHRGHWASRRLAWAVGFGFDATLPAWLPDRGSLVDAWVATLRRGEPMSPATPWLESARIVGDRVVLRELVEGDLPRLADPAAAGFVLERLEEAAEGRAVHWAVGDPVTDLCLGQVSLSGVQHRQQAELGYWTHPDARGRGLVTEAVRLVVRHCFVAWEDGGLGLQRLTAHADDDNAASRAVLRSAGFGADPSRYELLAPGR